MSDVLDEISLLKDEASSVRNVSHRTFSLLIGNYWLFFSVILIGVSFLTHQIPLFLVSLMFFLTGSVARLWDRYCLERVEYRRKLSANHAFYGDIINLDIAVSNRKPLPLPWFQLDEEIPEDVTLLKGNTSPTSKERRVMISNYISLGWYNRITRRFPIQCNQRGLFTFGPAVMRSGDLFGIFSRQVNINKEHYLTVYPKIVPLEELGIPSRQLYGDIRTTSHIFEDPVLTIGIRDYQFGDTLKKVHWKATARAGKLQTKIFELSTTTDIALFLDVRTTLPGRFGVVPELLELAIITAATISNYTLTEGFKTGLYVNHRKRIPDEPMRIPPGQHADQMGHILDALAQIDPHETMHISQLIQNESRNLSWGSTIVAVSAMPTDELLMTLYNMRRGGRKVVLVTIGGTNPPSSGNGLTVYHVSEDIPWRDIESVSLRGS